MTSAARVSMPPIRFLVAWTTLLGGLASCYTPAAPPEGDPCERSEQCPAPQRCVLGICSLHDPPVGPPADPPVDAPPAPPDAARIAPPDAAIDAPPRPCDDEDLACAGTTTTFTCGGACWVRCSAGAPRATAQSACTGWHGALGEINGATEDGCVAAQVAGTEWIGAIQSSAATQVDQGWTWNGATQMVYTRWATGKPDDDTGLADGPESGLEQCATLHPDGTWDDDRCSSALPFLCVRR